MIAALPVAEKLGPHKADFVGREKAKVQIEFSAYGKCNIVACEWQRPANNEAASSVRKLPGIAAGLSQLIGSWVVFRDSSTRFAYLE